MLDSPGTDRRGGVGSDSDIALNSQVRNECLNLRRSHILWMALAVK
jgi:hypothetical protein